MSFGFINSILCCFVISYICLSVFQVCQCSLFQVMSSILYPSTLGLEDKLTVFAIIKTVIRMAE